MLSKLQVCLYDFHTLTCIFPFKNGIKRSFYLLIRHHRGNIGCSPKDGMDKRQHWTTASRSFSNIMLKFADILFFCHFLSESVDQTKVYQGKHEVSKSFECTSQGEKWEREKTYQGEQQGSQAGVKYVKKLWREQIVRGGKSFQNSYLGKITDTGKSYHKLLMQLSKT